MRCWPILVVMLAMQSPSAGAQFWAKAEQGAKEPNRAYSDAGEPRSSAPTGPAASLGGSGATGPNSVGILPERDTDFDRKTWADTRFNLVVQLLERLPERIDSAAEHELARNLLVSIADAPPGDDGGSAILRLRVRKLLALGNIEDAAALARAAPDLTQDPELAREEIEAELLAGQIETACIDLRAFAGILTDASSAVALALCRQRDGEAVGEPITADVASLGPAARIAGVPLSLDPTNASPAQLVAVARDPHSPPEIRVEAAYGAGRASALLGERVAQIFRSAPATAAATPDGPPPSDGATAAALFRGAESEDAVPVKLGLAERALLSPVGVADKIGVAMASTLRSLQPVTELSSVAPRMAALFLTVADSESAAPWIDLASQSGSGAALWPYTVLLKNPDSDGQAGWEAQAGLEPPDRARILVILSAFGAARAPADPATGSDLPEPPLADLLAMDRAAKASHVGETVLRALALLGREGPAKAHPLTLARVLADLDLVRLHNQARALAFEAITATLTAARHAQRP